MGYWYGMKLRGYSLGCQPSDGLIKVRETVKNEYYNVLVYRRKLTYEEEHQYDLEYLGEETTKEELDKTNSMISDLEYFLGEEMDE